MSKIRVLHITPWFPHNDDPTRAMFISRHLQSLAPYCEQHVLHLDMDERNYIDGSNESITIERINPMFDSWRWKEWQFYRRLKVALRRLDARNAFTHVNFHIAYPALIYLSRYIHLLPPHRIITEHWSLYHYRFNMTKVPYRLQAIFRHNLPVICVSEAIANDIRAFCGQPVKTHVIPNVVERSVFYYRQKEIADHFFMAALWKHPKDPINLLEAIHAMAVKGKRIKLRIAGLGPLLADMKEFVRDRQMQEHVIFSGRLEPHVMAEEMRSAKAFIMPTRYETFSVASAEALCCGCPVIADAVGALPELITEENGLLRKANLAWEEIFAAFDTKNFEREKISESATRKYAAEAVGEQYFKLLQSL